MQWHNVLIGVWPNEEHVDRWRYFFGTTVANGALKDTVDGAKGGIDFLDVEEERLVYPFGFRLSAASLLDATGQIHDGQRVCAVLVFGRQPRKKQKKRRC